MKNSLLIKLAHITFWITYLVIYTWVFSHFMPVEDSIYRGVANGIPLLIIVYVNMWSVNRFFEKTKYFISVTIALTLIIGMVPIRMMINGAFPDAIIAADLLSKNESSRVGIVITNILFIMLSFFYQVIVNRFRTERSQTEELQVHQEAQLDYLKAQINPHFLFNTLNNIYSLAVVKSDKTPEMVVRLSHLLRYVVYDSQDKMVTLDKEMKHIDEYVELFKMRSMPAPKITINLEGDTNGVKIGPMILIPLVENCCKHCDFDTNDEAFVKIDVSVLKDEIVFTTKNTHNPYASVDQVGGVGLLNIKKRLEMLYDLGQNLETSEKEGIFIVNLRVHKNPA